MYTLKRPLYFPKCLLCNKVLMLRNMLGKAKEVIECPKCHVRYNRTFIKDADPEAWERVRRTQEFTVVEGADGKPQLFLRSGVGSRRKSL